MPSPADKRPRAERPPEPPLELLWTGSRRAARRLVLAHGAGAAMDSPFLEELAGDLAARGIGVARFEFPYMRRRRAEGSRRPPDRLPRLEESWREAVAKIRANTADSRPLAIGGKSMGGRVASRLADELADEYGVAGLVCLGYPFHPPGRPDRLRTEHLAGLRTPTLILQGTRDPFGNPAEVAGYDLSPAIEVRWLEDGDHSFKPRKSSGRTAEQNLAEAADEIERFFDEID